MLTRSLLLLFLTIGGAVAQVRPGVAPPPQEVGSDVNQGRLLYDSNCVACHGARGSGARSAFPPLAGAPVLKDKAALISAVLFPRPNTAMSSFCNLHAEEIAAVLTYIRKAWVSPSADIISSEEVLEVVRAHSERACRTAALSQKPLPRQILNFDLGWLAQTQLQALGQANLFPSVMPAFGAIVQTGDGKLYLVQSASLSKNDVLGGGASRRLPWSVRYLAPCAISRLAVDRGFFGWAVELVGERPYPRFESAFEISLLDEAETRRRFGTATPGQVHFSIHEMKRVCEGLLNDRYLW
jgi:cytochrome c6